MTAASTISLLDAPGPRSVVIRTVTEWLECGRLRPGEPLPSARALSRELRIDPRTVGVALNMLEEEGLIRQRSNGRRVVNGGSRANAPIASDSFLSSSVVMIGGPLSHNALGPLAQRGWSLQLELAARAAIQDNGHHFVVFNLAQLREQLPQLLRHRPLGVIVADPEHVEGKLMPVLQEAARDGLHVAVYGDTDRYEAFDRVVSDHEAGCFALTRWLIGEGRRRPVLLLPDDGVELPWAQGRRAGYERACLEAGIQPRPTIKLPRRDDGWGDPDAFMHKARVTAGHLAEALTGPDVPDALLAPSDGPAYAAAAACRLLHRRVHDDVMIVGYDNYWEGSPERRFEPFAPAATVDKRNDRIGHALVDLLVDRVAGNLPDAPQCRVIEPELIVNTSAQNVHAS
jgi:DNA-binding LacI/PurR family transcriptional regulator